MPGRNDELGDVYLQPGEMFLAHEPTLIRTVLGSCVSATFWSRKRRAGALCHAILPRCPQGYSPELRPEFGYRYVDFCIRDLARKFDELGADRSEIEVKLFGGADVLLERKAAPMRDTIGRLNCDTALEVLNAEGLQVVASSLRGKSGLKIQFNTGSGEVRLSRLKHISADSWSRGGAEGRNA